MKLTNEEVAKVFAMYFNADVINPKVPYISLKYNNVMAKWYDASYYERSESNSEFWDNRKLHLIPLYKISDDDTIKIWGIEGFLDAYRSYSIFINADGELRLQFGDYCENASSNTFQYLISKSYAVPLFFAPGHWANAKTAIELGIAIEK